MEKEVTNGKSVWDVVSNLNVMSQLLLAHLKKQHSFWEINKRVTWSNEMMPARHGKKSGSRLSKKAHL